MANLDTKYMRSADLLKIIRSDEIVKLAGTLLEEPVNEDLLALSLCDAVDLDCINRNKLSLYANLGLLSITKLEALEYYAFIICQQISNVEINPLTGSEKISLVAMLNSPEGYHSLDPFIYATSEAEDRPEDASFFSSAVLKEANIFIKYYSAIR